MLKNREARVVPFAEFDSTPTIPATFQRRCNHPPAPAGTYLYQGTSRWSLNNMILCIKMPAVALGKSAEPYHNNSNNNNNNNSNNDDGDGYRLKLPTADPESSYIFLPSWRRSPLLAKMRVYFLLALSFVCFTASLLLLLSPQSFPRLLIPLTFVKQQATDKPSNQWNLLYHLGGNGPWIPKIDGVVDGGIVIPNGCKIDMIHMVGCLSCCKGVAG